MTDSERKFVYFALEVLAIGGNGEGWTVNDAVNALRVALGHDDGEGPWRGPLDEDDRARLRAFVGIDRLEPTT